jgi:hypothetical protein
MFPTALTDGREGLQLVDAASGAASNDEMADHAHERRWQPELPKRPSSSRGLPTSG